MKVFDQRAVGFSIFFWMFIILIGLFVFFPLYWMINTSFKPMDDIFNYRFFPSKITLENFYEVIFETKVLMFMKNSVIVAGFSSVFATLVSAYAGYSFSKFKYRGKKLLMLLFSEFTSIPLCYSFINNLSNNKFHRASGQLSFSHIGLYYLHFTSRNFDIEEFFRSAAGFHYRICKD